MKKIIPFLFSYLMTSVCYADSFILDNQTPHPDASTHSKIAVEWASSAKEIEDGNNALLYALPLNSENQEPISNQGKITLQIPKKAEYFRILIWSNGEGDPDLHTNWVDIAPNKTYNLKTDHLVPTLLMAGTGC